jgi:leucyl-tRNA synthetase
MAEYDGRAVEERWQERWAEARAFEAEPDPARPKYFINFPYPYMNGYLHIGHTFSLLQMDFAARYHRLKGENVLWPFAFHCTGSPIVNAAQRVAEGEESQIRMLKEMDLTEEHIEKMGDPVYWTEFFPGETRKDVSRLGASVDWRRSFITTELNPLYDAFVQWQFNRLRELNYVVKGEHPVIWCPKDNAPVTDHARVRGQGETPQEYTLLKFKVEGTEDFLVAATLRPETVYGQTNLWVDPDIDYVRARVDDEVWIASRECLEKLILQHHEIESVGIITGQEMIGKRAMAPGINRLIPILPSGFCDPDIGTGIVTSVPSDAPDDWMGLVDLKHDPDEVERWGLDPKMVEEIEPIPIIQSEGWGPLPAVEISEQMEIADQYDRKKLEKAKEEIYKSGYYTGVMLDNTPHAGMKVEEAKDRVKEELIESGDATVMYEPTGEVVCRCLTPSVVKIVSDQWFIAYSDEEWKALTHKAFDSMGIYPPIARKQFDYVVDWLMEWACTREFGLGTRLPWDPRWIIESLSDSTVYMAYYTVAKHLEHQRIIPEDRIDPDFFAYCFEGKGDAGELAERYGCKREDIEDARSQFEYWYPYDVRGSGKDLIQNHLTFSVFNHTALWGEDKWPRAFAVNGWIRVEGEKMSKSLGNFLTMRQALEIHGADVTRFTLAMGGEGIDDPNWDPEIATTTPKRLSAWLEFVKEFKGRGRDQRRAIDDWFEAVLNRTLATARDHYDNFRFRSAIKVSYFDLQAHLRWYLRRCGREPQKDLMERLMAVQTQLLAPVVPHMAEEAWGLLGHEPFVALSSLPRPVEPDQSAKVAIAGEQLLVSTLEDVREILRITKIQPSVVRLFTAPAWKRRMFALARGMSREGPLEMPGLMKEAMADPEIRTHSKEAPNYAQMLVKDLPRTKEEDLERISTLGEEASYLEENRDFLERELGCEVAVSSADDPDAPDSGNKARQALPGRVAIYVE